MFTAKTPDDLPDRETIKSLSGLEFMQNMAAGKIARPPISGLLNYSLNLTRGIPLGTEIFATGIVDHAGRTTGVAHGEIRDAAGKLYATGSTTCLIMQLPA